MSKFENRMAAIQTALNGFETVLTAARPIDMAGFVHERVRLSRSVNEFLSSEWDSLRERLAADAERSGQRSGDEALYREFAKLRANYSSHIQRWDSSAIVSQWAGYRRDAERLIASMRRLLEARSSLQRALAA